MAAAVLPQRPAFLFDTPRMDVLSDALRIIRLQGALFLNAEFREPWSVAAPTGAELARAHWPGRDQVAICHFVLQGTCWIQLPGGEPLALRGGDVAVLPHGSGHLLGSSALGTRVAPSDAIKVKLPELARACYGGNGPATHLICGWFAYERTAASPIMAALPAVFRADLRGRPSGAWIEQSICHAIDEAGSARPGWNALAEKVAEALFIEALRGYAESAEATTGWLASLRDPLVGGSIALMHERPAHPWTVASLARGVNASRTVLAERFTALVGVPPMQYLTHWRIALAAHLLSGADMSLARVAERVGYDSEAAFSRAFKREHGMPPGAWRRSREASRAATLRTA